MMINRIFLALISAGLLLLSSIPAILAAGVELQFPKESIGALYTYGFYFASMKNLGKAQGKVDIDPADLNKLFLELNDYAIVHPEKILCPGFQKISCLGFSRIGIEHDWIKKLGMFAKYKNIKVLRLDRSRASDSDMRYITAVPSVIALSLAKTGIEGKKLSALNSLELKSLSLSKTNLAPEAFKELAKLKKLDELFIDNLTLEWLASIHDFAEIDAKLAPVMAPLGEMKALTSICMAGMPCGKKSLKFLGSLKNLKRLRAERTDIDTSILKELKSAPLIFINLANCNAIDDASLAEISTHKTLLSLKLCWVPKITEKGLNMLSGLSKLKDLDLKATSLKNSKLAFLKGMPNLKTLILEDTGISDEAAKQIANNPELVELHVSGTNVSDKSVPLICSLKQLTILHTDGSKISADGIARIKKAHPNCNVVSDAVR